MVSVEKTRQIVYLFCPQFPVIDETKRGNYTFHLMGQAIRGHDFKRGTKPPHFEWSLFRDC